MSNARKFEAKSRPVMPVDVLGAQSLQSCLTWPRNLSILKLGGDLAGGRRLQIQGLRRPSRLASPHISGARAFLLHSRGGKCHEPDAGPCRKQKAFEISGLAFEDLCFQRCFTPPPPCPAPALPRPRLAPPTLPTPETTNKRNGRVFLTP